MKEYIRLIHENVRLKEGVVAIKRMLHDLYYQPSMSTKELARVAALPIPVATAIKKECEKLGLTQSKAGVSLTETGRAFLEETYGYGGLRSALYGQIRSLPSDRELYAKARAFGTEQIEWADAFTNSLSKLPELFANRPKVDVTLDQAYATVETSLARAHLALEQGVLLGKRILCVGDDDLVSVSIGFLLKYLYADMQMVRTQVCVLEKDPRLLAYLAQIADEYGLPITCIESDLRDPLPIDLIGSFDVVYTDPPYTLDGLTLFLSRGIGGLKIAKGLSIFLSFAQKPNEDEYRMQELFVAHGLIVKAIHAAWNEYEGASLFGNRSNMILLETTEHTKAVIPATLRGKEKIYTADHRTQGTRYRCDACGWEFVTGQASLYRTIEQAKLAGCPQCGKTKFLKKSPTPSKNPFPASSQIRGYEHSQEQDNGESVSVKRALGEHILADFFGCDSDLLNHVDHIGLVMEEAAKRAHAHVVGKEFHHFSPWGVSGAILIKESHLTIHTWPEYQYAAVDIFTCGNSLDLWKAISYLKDALQADTMETFELGRGMYKFGGIDKTEKMILDER
ncbi:MAG: adenosylmethionine decarboxylase [Lachnospiraceae bacterium]|jgi:S-adenosylmethionine decarboxylase proenzyme|nr:adenosylmethionine decarboxylase [Lachnospiraceae bacterium]